MLPWTEFSIFAVARNGGFGDYGAVCRRFFLLYRSGKPAKCALEAERYIGRGTWESSASAVRRGLGVSTLETWYWAARMPFFVPGSFVAIAMFYLLLRCLCGACLYRW